MPRRNRNPRVKRYRALERRRRRSDAEPPPPTYSDMARDLVRRGLRSPRVLDPMSSSRPIPSYIPNTEQEN